MKQPISKRPHASSVRTDSGKDLRAFGDLSWTSGVPAENTQARAPRTRSVRLETVSAALMVAICLAGLTLGLRSLENALQNMRASLLGPASQPERLTPWIRSDVLTEPWQGAGETTDACPAGMVLVEGQYCPKVEHRCVRWLEREGPHAFSRCAEYSRNARCLAPRREMSFCIDREEHALAGEHLPASHQSWTEASRVCESVGKRLCMESEWVFACEGEAMHPYPYGFTRDAGVCNADRQDLYRPDGELRDLRDGPAGHPRCVSPFGVHHLAGNLEEWTTADGSSPPRPVLKGAYWQPGRNHCRAAQTAHDRYYSGTETGFRCCRDAEDEG